MGAATQTASVIPHSAEKHPGSTAKGSGGGKSAHYGVFWGVEWVGVNVHPSTFCSLLFAEMVDLSSALAVSFE